MNMTVVKQLLNMMCIASSRVLWATYDMAIWGSGLSLDLPRNRISVHQVHVI